MLWRRFSHDCSSVPAVGPSRAARRTSRGHLRAGARLSPFRSVPRRSRRRRRRDDHAARRSLAAGAARARRGFRLGAEGAARGRACARRRSAGDRHPRAGALAAADGRRPGRLDRHRASGSPGCDRHARAAAALARRGDRRSRHRRRPALCCWKISTPISRLSRSTAWSSASAIWRRSAKTCWRAPICRWRRARRCSPSCRRRWPASSSRGNGSGWSMPNTPRARLARRRPSRSPPTRLTRRLASWCSICAKAGN